MNQTDKVLSSFEGPHEKNKPIFQSIFVFHSGEYCCIGFAVHGRVYTAMNNNNFVPWDAGKIQAFPLRRIRNGDNLVRPFNRPTKCDCLVHSPCGCVCLRKSKKCKVVNGNHNLAMLEQERGCVVRVIQKIYTLSSCFSRQDKLFPKDSARSIFNDGRSWDDPRVAARE